MSLRVSFYTLAAIAVWFAAALPANAQGYGRNQQGMRPQKIKTVGTVISATANQIQVSSGSQTVYVMLGNNTEVSVTGTAEQEYLKPGVTVEFVAEVAKGGAVKEKIDHLTVVTPTTDHPLGYSAPTAGESSKKGDKDDKKAAHDPGIADAPAAGRKRANNDANAFFGGDTASGKPARGSGATQFPGTYTVRGTIRMCKDGKITVSAGHGPTVRAELSPDATIDVDMSDPRVAQRDDKITVNGMTSQARPNMVMAQSVNIELANPLTGKKHGKPKAPANTKPKKDKDADSIDAAGK